MNRKAGENDSKCSDVSGSSGFGSGKSSSGRRALVMSPWISRVTRSSYGYIDATVNLFACYLSIWASSSERMDGRLGWEGALMKFRR